MDPQSAVSISQNGRLAQPGHGLSLDEFDCGVGVLSGVVAPLLPCAVLKGAFLRKSCLLVLPACLSAACCCRGLEQQDPTGASAVAVALFLGCFALNRRELHGLAHQPGTMHRQRAGGGGQLHVQLLFW